MKKRVMTAHLAVQPMLGEVNSKGQIVGQQPIGPEKVIDTIHFDADTVTRQLTVTSETSGASVTVGFTPAYAKGYDRVFGKSSNN